MSEKGCKDLPAPLSLSEAVPEPVRGKEGILAESGETYLETILLIKERSTTGLVRAVDIANELSFSKPSVSRALSQLKERGLISIEPSGAIILTEAGASLAQAVVYRHRLLTYFLSHALSVPSQIAERDACRMEHVISEETLDCIVDYLYQHKMLPEDLERN